MRHRLAVVFFSLLFVNQAHAESSYADLLTSPLRIREQVTVRLDGSETALFLQTQSETLQELVWIDEKNFRIRREAPFTLDQQEFLVTQGIWQRMTPSNRRILAIESPSLESVYRMASSPIEWAKVLGLSNQSSLSDLVDKASSLKEPLILANGSEWSAEKLANNGIRMKMSGRWMTPAKVEAQVQIVWELLDRNKTSLDQLGESLLRRI